MQPALTPGTSPDGGRARLRLVCPEYPAFNIYSRPARVMTALGPVCVATAINDVPGWDAEIIDENNYRRGPRRDDGRVDHHTLQADRPAAAVGLYGGLTSTIPRLMEIATLYKSMGVITIAGGQHFVEENIETALRGGVDIVVIGEGEKTIVELIHCLETGGDLRGVNGIAFLDDQHVVQTPDRDVLTDFNALPVPDYSLLRYAKLKYYSISGVRGCGMHCEFCTVKARPRASSADRMMTQFATVYEKWKGRIFFVVDDLFGQNRSETLRLCEMLHDYQVRVGVRFSITVQIRLDKAGDTELLTAMRRAGINVLAIGLESPIAEELDAMNKHLKPQEMIDLARTYHRAGFRMHGMFIFGYPAREGSVFPMPAARRVSHFRRFIRRARLDTVQIMLPVPLPGTELTARLRAQGRVYPTDCVGLEYYDGNFPLFDPDPPLTPETMQQAVRKIMRGFYRPQSMFSVGLHILSFPTLAFHTHRFRVAWQRWYRRWTRSLYRTGGWLLLRRWTAAFKKDGFDRKLARAKQQLQC